MSFRLLAAVPLVAALSLPAVADAASLSKPRAKREIENVFRQELAVATGVSRRADLTACPRRARTVVDCRSRAELVQDGGAVIVCTKTYRARLTRSNRVSVTESDDGRRFRRHVTSRCRPAATKHAAKLTSSSKLSDRGIGPLKVGMRVADVARATGLRVKLPPAAQGTECQFASLVGGPRNTGFIASFGIVRRVDVWSIPDDNGVYRRRSPIATTRGVKIGQTEDDVAAAYGKVSREPHKYVEGGEYLTFKTRRGRIIFETDAKNRITAIRAGLAPEVGFIEGCA